MNINVLNEDNLFFFRKVLEQVPSQESHSGLYGLRSLRSDFPPQPHPFPTCPQPAPAERQNIVRPEDSSPASPGKVPGLRRRDTGSWAPANKPVSPAALAVPGTPLRETCHGESALLLPNRLHHFCLRDCAGWRSLIFYRALGSPTCIFCHRSLGKRGGPEGPSKPPYHTEGGPEGPSAPLYHTEGGPGTLCTAKPHGGCQPGVYISLCSALSGRR